MFSKLITVAGLIAAVNGHMKMKSPAPFNPAGLNNSPLEPDMSNFPCKFGGGYSATGGQVNSYALGSSRPSPSSARLSMVVALASLLLLMICNRVRLLLGRSFNLSRAGVLAKMVLLPIRTTSRYRIASLQGSTFLLGHGSVSWQDSRNFT